ncbi:MAG: beta-galactosidase, partial [Staphylococcus equorum]|nr:beta-galactosidase [Staphylococcus equorum]
MNLASRQVHLDFHTGKLPYDLGKNFNKTDFQETLQSSHINSITLTGRDHHGWVYYQSQNFIQHPQLGKRDFLKEQVDACHEIGIKAPIYLTAGWDAYSASKYPEWLERQIDGKTYGFEDHNQLEPGWKTLCFNTAYVEYLVTQTKDLLQHFDYQVDGLFYDILWQDQCFCNECICKMQEENLNPENEHDRKKFATETEQHFKDRIVEAIHSVAPECPVVFNEGNITPIIRPNLADYDHLEIESLPGGKWGYQHFPATVRYAKNLGKEYMGMTGRFHLSWGDFGSYRDEPALEYENFLALIHGAKCSIGDQMYPDGTLSKKAYKTIGKVYSEVEKYEQYEQNVESVSNIAIIHPEIVEESDEQVDVALAGAVNILNELHLEFTVVDDLMDWEQYELLILPDKIKLSSKLEKKLDKYIETGGKII